VTFIENQAKLLRDAGRDKPCLYSCAVISNGLAGYFRGWDMRKVARVRGIEVAYEDAGRGEPADASSPRMPVVLLHGFPFNRSLWREQWESLSETYRVVAPDLRGHGETEVAATATMEEMAEDLAALLDGLKVERAVVGGVSMGGYVALAFLRAHPGRVVALVLVDTRAQADTDEGRRAREEAARRAEAFGMAPIADSMLPRLLAPATRERRPDVVARVREMILGMKPEGAAAVLRGMAARRDQTDLLEKIDVPTLVVVGSDDVIASPAEAEAMRARIRGARLVEIGDAGHVPCVERPGEFNRALAQFLDGLPARGVDWRRKLK
jgi:pimeloyl-ACP methyl ester carboxylesterase